MAKQHGIVQVNGEKIEIQPPPSGRPPRPVAVPSANWALCVLLAVGAMYGMWLSIELAPYQKPVAPWLLAQRLRSALNELRLVNLLWPWLPATGNLLVLELVTRPLWRAPGRRKIEHWTALGLALLMHTFWGCLLAWPVVCALWAMGLLLGLPLPSPGGFTD